MENHSALYPLILAGLYPDPDQWIRAQRILDKYSGNNPANKPFRVWIAILKLSGSDLEKLEHYTGIAVTDFRDVLAWAEYPHQMSTESWKMDKYSPEYQALLKKDREQYDAWIDSILGK